MNWRVPEWFAHLSEETQRLLKMYFEELVKWNPKINLVSPTTLLCADNLHFSDSLSGSAIIFGQLPADSKQLGIYDIGSGNGFPGVVFAILYRQIPVFCVESDERKGAFLRQLGLKAGLKNLNVLTSRVEALPLGSIKYGMSRAFASLDKSAELTSAVFVRDARYFHFKGPEWKSEIGINCSTWNNFEVGSYHLRVEVIENGESKAIKRFIIASTRI